MVLKLVVVFIRDGRNSRVVVAAVVCLRIGQLRLQLRRREGDFHMIENLFLKVSTRRFWMRNKIKFSN